MAEKRTIRRFSIFVLALAVFFLLLWLFSGPILGRLGQFLICDEEPVASDAVVVLNTGVEYYPRLIEAADLFRKGFAQKVIINGNRKPDVLRDLESKGFKECCPWYEDRIRILEILGVPRKDILTISAEDAYDTVSEAEVVGRELFRENYRKRIRKGQADNVILATWAELSLLSIPSINFQTSKEPCPTLGFLIFWQYIQTGTGGTKNDLWL